jgi:phosphoribosylaminoimidazole-succinocarboxamide synthase
MSETAVFTTDFPDLKLYKRGKVRDIYDMGDSLLMVATDRISAFDVIMETPIPEKGKILTQISLFWFDVMKDVTDNHVLTGNVSEYPSSCKPYADVLKDRSMLVKKTETIPIECVARGYISGSAWKSYKQDSQVCGIPLPHGLKESGKLPEPLFTPSTKAELGEHDINIDFEETAERIGRPLAEKLKSLTLEIYRKGAGLAEEKGIIIADTKFEFGTIGDKIYLIDEILTPDSSRFWPKSEYEPGKSQKSFDKQYLRDHLLSMNWDKTPPPPSLPEEVVENTRNKYLEALNRLTDGRHGI